MNFVTKHPEPGSPWSFYTEQIGGAYGYYSTFNVIHLIAGISNLTDQKYYNRVFANGIEPAPRRSGYAGLSLQF